ncbi:lysozyme inhibitor LprI family protein [uncultured Maricaulis sp.]|uniref:lysozyme inhibitor LprI family protein n=1 Tax=uncultured Maricaulis sp. TaxID=174710 RepID=UPI0030D7A14F|tara:strand:+ start:42202 stop:42702 length:501 start_codon:yes stop_codon:yes gene_type:complete
MRVLMLATSLAIGLSACGYAQKTDGPAHAMPILSPANTIEACVGQYPDTATREATCIGQYSSACMTLRADGETNSGMIRCTGEEYAAWDSRLNTAYTRYMQQLGAPRDEGLREAQRAWMALRDADCEFEASAFAGGSMQPLVTAACMRDYAARRTIRLLGWLEEPR